MLTISEWAKLNPTPLASGVVEVFASENPVLQGLPFINIAGNAYTYNRETSLPGVAFRGFNEGYTESTGVVNPATESLTIVGGDSDYDVAQIKMQTGDNNTRAVYDAMKAKALTLTWLKTFFAGDSAVNAKEFDGLNARLDGGTQEIVAGANGDVLTLSMVDDLIDKITGTPSMLLVNKPTLRKINDLARAANQATEVVNNQFGQRITMYAGVPIGVIEDGADGNPILGFTETQGTATDTCSLYAVKYGLDALHGIQTAPIDVRDLGEIDSKPAYRTRIEWYSGLVVKHPKAVARLRGVTLA